jgi:anti-sigma regulatory factor (Ser/Thr protein kinase)
MKTMASPRPTRPTRPPRPPRPAEEQWPEEQGPEEQWHCVALTTGPAAAAQARSEVQAAISNWEVPVDPGVAVLLTSELVTNAIKQEGGIVTLAVTAGADELRVDVHDTSRAWPIRVEAAADAETGRGLILVDTLSAQWGFYPTPTGKGVYFTLAFPPDPGEGAPSPRRDGAQG